jgi:DNA modification methylase
MQVYREVWRVLRNDGTCFVNLGDSYATNNHFANKVQGNPEFNLGRESRAQTKLHVHGVPKGFKRKSLIGVPWRFAFAMMDEGWILRQEIIWHKVNPMPESCLDRPHTAHERIFLFSKKEKYYYDAEAVKEPATGGAHSRGRGNNPKKLAAVKGEVRANESFDTPYLVEMRHRRSLWSGPNQAWEGAHFATFPEWLIEPCVLATPSQTCEHCGKGWVRIVEHSDPIPTGRGGSHKQRELIRERRGETSLATSAIANGALRQTKTLGWKPGCKCQGNTGAGRAVILDPFAGSGTTGQVATRFGRRSILIDLNPEYIEQAEQRTDRVQLQFVG